MQDRTILTFTLENYNLFVAFKKKALTPFFMEDECDLAKAKQHALLKGHGYDVKVSRE